MLRVREVKIAGASLAYAIEGTPVDAVSFGRSGARRRSPVRRGGRRHQPGLGAGLRSDLDRRGRRRARGGGARPAGDRGDPGPPRPRLRRVGEPHHQAARLWLAKGLPEGIALSINVPGAAADRPRGVVVARLGQPEFVVGGFHKVESADPRQLWRLQWDKVRRPERESDLDWYQRGEITITPLRWDSERRRRHARADRMGDQGAGARPRCQGPVTGPQRPARSRSPRREPPARSPPPRCASCRTSATRRPATRRRRRRPGAASSAATSRSRARPRAGRTAS